MDARNALAEARVVTGSGAWVLEPSPPAVAAGPFFADDPVAAGDLDWVAWVDAHPDAAAWASERWLAAWPRLGAAPSGLVETRKALHRIAFWVMAPARAGAPGAKIGLRWTLGGFGTPFFGADEQTRVGGSDLILQRGSSAVAQPITTLARAAQFVLGGPVDPGWADGLQLRDPPELGDVDQLLRLNGAGSRFLGNWYGFAWSVLEELRADPESVDASRVQLWPEHFDAAVECLPGERRATFGASPGDGGCPEPYLYVTSPRVAAVPGELWNATAFDGADLPLHELAPAADQRGVALEFFRTRRAALASS